ncbi:MAG: molybdenum ABC transporter ATP-binding protein [Cellvibrionaceae bacterium]|nr:molybdenum ABC transporter ATP-binding protein [Cellvibrionaceae bacterium]|tara:strand:+ start:41505 stop:42311 length:807 start_codon:yes stop_codon:yes gene_type:complete
MTFPEIMTPPLLDIHNVSAYRGDNKVFSGLNLRIEQGEQVAILGPNGAGKSTLLKLLTRELYPVEADNSHVKILGSDTVNVQQLRQQIGWVSYDFHTQYLPITTGFDVVLSGLLGAIGHLYQHDISDAQKQTTHDTMVQLNLLELRDTMFHHLSSGQQRRLILARALVHNPQHIIFDEPTSSLDLQGMFQVLKDMETQSQLGRSVILATHHLHELLPSIERIIFLKQGKVIADGGRDQLLTEANLSDLYDSKIQLINRNGVLQAFPAA